MSFFTKIFRNNNPDKIKFEDFLELSDVSDDKIKNYLETFNIRQYTYPHLNGDNNSYQKFIILGNMRTGSTHLANMLMSHSQVVCFHELFQKNATFFYPGYPLPSNEKMLRLRNEYPVKFLETFVFKNYQDNIKAVGFKLFYHQAQNAKLKEVWNYLQNSENIKIIHLQRQNLFENYVSLQIALKTDIWAVVEPETNEKIKHNNLTGMMPGETFASNFKVPKITIDKNACLDYFKEVTQRSQECIAFFKNKDIHSLYYEDLINNQAVETEKLSSFLDIPVQKLSSAVVRQNNENIDTIVTNYNTLKEEFKNTQWIEYFTK